MTQPAARTASATGHVAVTGTESGALSAATLTSGAAVGASASQTVSVPPAQLHRQVPTSRLAGDFSQSEKRCLVLAEHNLVWEAAVALKRDLDLMHGIQI